MLLHDDRPEHVGNSHSRRRRRSPTWKAVLALLVLLVVLVAPTASYVRALVAPGEADWQVRTVEWIRDHGGGPVVDMVENWWYAHNQPTGLPPAGGTVPPDDPGVPPVAPPAAVPAAAVPTTAAPPPLPL